jgi:hypothetical protein
LLARPDLASRTLAVEVGATFDDGDAEDSATRPIGEVLARMDAIRAGVMADLLDAAVYGSMGCASAPVNRRQPS